MRSDLQESWYAVTADEKNMRNNRDKWGKMGQRRTEQYHRSLSWLKWMMGLNLVLLVLIIVLSVGAVTLNRRVKQLTAELERVQSEYERNVDDTSDENNNEDDTSLDENEVNATVEQQETTAAQTDAGTEETRNYIVCLDAGHGGAQGHGATSTLDGRIESHDTLKITLAVQKALEAYEDVTVVMTRTEDVEVDNGVRAEIANNADADLFVSFHRNSNTAGNKSGVEGWIHSSNPQDSRAAGELILAAMEVVGVAENFGVKCGTWDEPDVNYKIIRLAEMPAVLLEVGYLNSAIDNQLFDQNVDAYAEATAEAIYIWLGDWVER